MSASLSAELSALSPSQKREVIESLWESLDACRDVPVPAWHLEELQRRAEDQRQHPRAGTPLPEVKARLLGEHA